MTEKHKKLKLEGWKAIRYAVFINKIKWRMILTMLKT